MTPMNRREFLAMAGASPLMPSLIRWIPQVLATPPKGGFRDKYFPDVILRTHENKQVRFYNDLIKDKIVVVNFMYARCEKLCPRQTTNLVEVQRELGDRVGRNIFFYSISLKPEEDTPAHLMAYAKAHHTGPGWLFLTGAPVDVELLRRKFGFVDPDPDVDAKTSEHIGLAVYGNEAKERWSACPCLTNPREMARYIGWMEWPRVSLS
jgi:protein SCO1/2